MNISFVNIEWKVIKLTTTTTTNKKKKPKYNRNIFNASLKKVFLQSVKEFKDEVTV